MSIRNEFKKTFEGRTAKKKQTQKMKSLQKDCKIATIVNMNFLSRKENKS